MTINEKFMVFAGGKSERIKRGVRPAICDFNNTAAATIENRKNRRPGTDLLPKSWQVTYPRANEEKGIA
jgi:hypothetical protein